MDPGVLYFLVLAGVASLLGLMMAVVDKRRARRDEPFEPFRARDLVHIGRDDFGRTATFIRGRGRVPEAAFHALTLLGGWPGLAVGFLVMRHKTRKIRFLVTQLVFAALHVALVAWLLDLGSGLA